MPDNLEGRARETAEAEFADLDAHPKEALVSSLTKLLIAFAQAEVIKERERCAKVAESKWPEKDSNGVLFGLGAAGREVARTIRSQVSP